MEGVSRNLPQREAVRWEQLGVGWTGEQALEFIANCYDRDALLHTLLGFSERWMAHRIILLLGNQQAQPYLLRGWLGLDARFEEPEVLRQIRVALPADAPFFAPEEAERAFVARPEDVSLGRLFVELCLFPPEELIVQSILIGKRPAMTLLGEARPGAMGDLEELSICARAVGEQLTELVRLAKANQLPPPDARVPALPAPADTPQVAPDEPADKPPEPLDERSGESSVPEGLHIVQKSEGRLRAAGSTAYGLPFVDHSSGETLHLQNVEATAFGLPFIDGEDDEPAAPGAPLAQVWRRPEEVPQTEDSDAQDAAHEDASDEDSHAQYPPPIQSEENLARITWDGGFSVTEFERGLLREGEHAPGAPPQDAHAEAGASASLNDSAAHEAAAAPPSAPRARQSTAPSAQILRPRSLKHGRREKGSGAHPAVARAGASSSGPVLDLEVARTQFPGALQVDRYQYSIETLPTVDRHSQLLADLVALGAAAVPLASSLLEHSSGEVRFYATMLFTRLPLESVVDQLIPRLFDRDYQTREIARQIILDYRARTRVLGQDWFEANLCLPLREIILDGTEDIRLETAADLLGTVRCAGAVDALIAGLGRYRGRVKNNLGRALRAITYKDLPPSHSEWLNWRTRAQAADAQQTGRAQWIVDALNAEQPEIRQLVYEEIREIDGLVLNYHPDQPEKLRIRAQNDLREWFNAQAVAAPPM